MPVTSDSGTATPRREKPDWKSEHRRFAAQAVAVLCAVIAVLVVLFDFSPAQSPAAAGALGKVTLINLGNSSRAGRGEMLRWLEIHDPGLFSRSDSRHGYLAFLPPVGRPSPEGTGRLEFPLDAPRVSPNAPGYQPLSRLDFRETDFGGYPAGGLPPPRAGSSPEVGGVRADWSVASPPEVDWSEASRSGSGSTAIRVTRSAAPAEVLRYEIRSGGNPELNPLLWNALSEPLSAFLKPGETVDLIVHWPSGGRGSGGVKETAP